jgi:tetratricopeptide (TPR) repeat protein
MVQAEALTRRSKFEEAIAIYQDLSKRAPNNARPEIGWAWALLLDDSAGLALAHAQRAMELDSGSAAGAAVLSRAQFELGDDEAALANAQRAVQLDPSSAAARAVLAEAYWSNGQAEEALKAADLALALDAGHADAHRIRGLLSNDVEGDPGQAVRELQTAAGLEPELWARRHELGQLLLQLGQYETALLALQDALAIRPMAATFTAMGDAYYQMGQYDEAWTALQQAVAVRAEGDVETYALLAAVAAHRGSCDQATLYSDEALALDPANLRASEAAALCARAALESPAEPSGASAATPSPTSAATPRPSANPTRAPAPALSGRIAFPVWNKERGGYDTFVARTDGSERQLVVERMHQPSFSPDGKWLAVNGERPEQMNLFIVGPDGSGLKEISRHIEDSLPYWSPDAQSLVFSSTMHGDKQSRVYIIDQVPFAGRQQQGRPLNFGPDVVRGSFPAWTAGNRILYKGCDLTVSPATCGLFSMAANPGVQPFTQLTTYGEDSAPAPRGDQVAFMSNRAGNWEIYLMNQDGTEVRRLTNRAAQDGLPTWSPDGKTIAFVSDQGGNWAVWALNPPAGSQQGTDPRKLFDLGGSGLAFDWQNERISWAP